MAKQKTKLKQFFEGRRRMCRLEDFHVLKDRADVVRMKMTLSMPLSRTSLTGMPEDFASPYIIMEKEKSTCNRSVVNVAVEAAKLSIFSTDTHAESVMDITGSTLQGFKLVAEGVDDKRTVSLDFDVYVPYVVQLKDWTIDHLHKDFFAEVVPAQMEIKDDNPSDPVDPEPNRKVKGKKKAAEQTLLM